MKARKSVGRRLALGVSALAPLVLAMALPVALTAEPEPIPDTVTFTKDIAPILQRSCQNCHRPESVAPMSLITYEDARPWARAIKHRTSIRDKAGAMPPWYIEKDIGIQHYKNDPSLSDEELAKIAKWADSGAPRGNPEDMPPPRTFADAKAWEIGEPDLIVRLPDITMKSDAPDWWGEIANTPTGLTEDRYVAAVEIKEFNDVNPSEKGRLDGRRALHLPPHDLEHAGAERGRGAGCRVPGHLDVVAGARGRP